MILPYALGMPIWALPDWRGVPAGTGTAAAGALDCGVHDLVANLTPEAGDVLILPEATTHGVLPWRAPPGRRRRIFSMRFHIQHGELRPYREQKGVVCAADFPAWMHKRLAPETLELLLGADISHTKAIATHPDGIALASFDELYPPLPGDGAARL